MNETNVQKGAKAGKGGPLPTINFPKKSASADWATVLGLFATFGLIAGAIMAGQSNANFFNVPAFLIVVLGTLTATAICYSGAELVRAWHIFTRSFIKRKWNLKKLAYSLIDLSVVGKKRGILALSSYDTQMRQDAFLQNAVQMAVDGYQPQHIAQILKTEIDALAERHKKSAAIARRASEIAPAMGLIGTLIGLVQMLADLENPEMLGPSMAVAILTTLYGAVLGMVVLASLATKLERKSNEETLIKTLIAIATVSIARQDNPRQLEMQLNAELPPDERIIYFD